MMTRATYFSVFTSIEFQFLTLLVTNRTVLIIIRNGRFYSIVFTVVITNIMNGSVSNVQKAHRS